MSLRIMEENAQILGKEADAERYGAMADKEKAVFLEKFYDADGIFPDIVGVRKCHCQYCTRTLLEEGKDPLDDRAALELEPTGGWGYDHFPLPPGMCSSLAWTIWA